MYNNKLQRCFVFSAFDHFVLVFQNVRMSSPEELSDEFAGSFPVW